MPAIKSASEIAKKWARVTPGRVTDYQEGIQNPKKDWATEAANAEGRYKTGVIAAANAGQYGKGIKKSGTDKWQKKALEKGPSRFSEGVMLAEGDYEAGFAPYADVISRTELPTRGPKGDPININRVSVLAKALHDKKIKG